jgi:CRP-like cAMP-binding protein
MNQFLSRISQLQSVHDVMLLSPLGEPLFYACTTSPAGISQNTVTSWNTVIACLNATETADFVFETGHYYLLDTKIGHIVIGLTQTASLTKVRDACCGVKVKLKDSAVRKKTLLKLLADTDDIFKAHVIKLLVPFADEEVAQALTALLQKEKLMKADVRNKLLLFICRALGYCPSMAGLLSLRTFLTNHQTTGDSLPLEIKTAAQLAIHQLELSTASITAEATSQDEGREKTIFEKDVTVHQETKHISITDLPQEQQIVAAIEDGDTKQARALILLLIKTCSAKKQFDKAEQLRNWLIEIDSMALLEIVRAAEIIEEAQKASITQEHQTTWKELTTLLSPETFSALYHATTPKHFNDGEIIVRQGQLKHVLFFINSGRVQLFTRCQGSQTALNVLEQGTIFGAEAFFENSVWTISAKSMGAEVLILQDTQFQTLQDNFPSVETKLKLFCSRLPAHSKYFQKSKRTRRQFERKSLSCRVAITVLGPKGEDTGIHTKGELLDISTGGMSMSIHASQKHIAKRLLGKTIRVTISGGMYSGSVIGEGDIRAVRGFNLIGNQYSLHVEMHKQLSYKDIQQALTAGKE